MVDIGMLAERAADYALEARDLARAHAPLVALIPEIHAKLDVALRPTHRPRYVNYAVVVIAFCAVILAWRALGLSSRNTGASVGQASDTAQK